MDRHHYRDHRQTRRQPLSDTTDQINNQQAPTTQRGPDLPSPRLPHHESLKPGHNLHLLNNPKSPISSIENKRLSTIAGEEDTDSKRDSQISTTSTNASATRPRKRFVGPWQLGPTIGTGASGRVRRAKHAMTGQYAAIKIVGKRSALKYSSRSVQAMDIMMAKASNATDGRKVLPYGIEREVVIMKLIEHPNVISLYDVWENRSELYLVLEFVEGGELFNYITKHQQLSEKESVRIFRQIISGLAYCHRFHICHRDLKPENILLDRHRNIKIVDFGMAALQPADQMLYTSCGSPHYAPPEIALDKPYMGDRADIWSCGVVLYVMLTGRLPFGNGDEEETVKDVLQEVVAGVIEYPQSMSQEAHHLIYWMLQPKPQERISIDMMWKHPLLLKYEAFSRSGPDVARWIGGPPPPLTPDDCGRPIHSRGEIDRELLRNLQTLWHNVNQEDIVQGLLNDEPNYEKLFYSSLLRFREEQLENYQGPPIELSASDYHHMPKPPPKRSTTRTSLQAHSNNRRRSQFSILSSNAPRTSQSYVRQPSIAETASSYDPFRPSRNRISSNQAERFNVTVFRGASAASHSIRNSSDRNPIKTAPGRHAALPRVQDEETHAISSSPPPLPSLDSLPAAGPGQIRRLRKERITQMYSRSSLASSTHQHSIGGARKSASYKRGVSFAHKRKRSTSEQLPSSRLQQVSSPLTLQQKYLNDRQGTSSPAVQPHTPSDSPQPSYAPLVRSKKDTPGLSHAHELAARKAKTPSHYWKEDARVVSRELGNFMDEVFNQSTQSLGPTAVDPEAEPRDRKEFHATRLTVPKDSVASSTVACEVKTSDKSVKDPYCERPLPRLPGSELIGSYTQRELAKARNLLKQRAVDLDGAMAPGYLDDVIAHLDRLMQPSTIRAYGQDWDRRVVSAPDPLLPGSAYLNHAAAEDQNNRHETRWRMHDQAQSDYRITSDPTPRRPITNVKQSARLGVAENESSIRIVHYDGRPLSPIRPLVIRKRSGASTPSEESERIQQWQEQQPRELSRELPALVQYPHDHRKAEISRSNYAQGEEWKSDGLNLVESQLEPIAEDDNKEALDSRAWKTQSGDSKKRGWFRWQRGSQQSQENDRGPTPPVKDQWPLQDLVGAEFQREIKGQNGTSDEPSQELQRAESDKKRSNGRGRFFKIFSKKDPKEDKGLALGSDDFDDSASLAPSSIDSCRPLASGTLQNSNAANISDSRNQRGIRSGGPPKRYTNRPIQPQPQNWLARFLHIKPAVKILSFQVSKIRARKEIAGILKEWRKYGMRDVTVDKVAGRIWARVSNENLLHIKPVSLAVELFTVLDRGRRANLCVARFTQEKGAKSSFEKVLETLEGVCGKRGLLVGDARRARDMARCLGG